MTPEEAQGHARWALEYALENDETYLEPETVDELREALAVLTTATPETQYDMEQKVIVDAVCVARPGDMVIVHVKDDAELFKLMDAQWEQKHPDIRLVIMAS